MKIGIFGARRGMNYARHFVMLNCEIVAICENRPEIKEGVEIISTGAEKTKEEIDKQTDDK